MDDVIIRNQQSENIAFFHQAAADALRSFLYLCGYWVQDFTLDESV